MSRSWRRGPGDAAGAQETAKKARAAMSDPVPSPATQGTGKTPPGAPEPVWVPHTSPSRKNRNSRGGSWGTATDVRHAGHLALAPEEVRRLLGAIDRLEERCLLELAVTTGIRREDLAAIPLEGVNLDRATLKFYESKKRRTREIPLDPTAAVTLRSYARTLPKGCRWLFPSPRRQGAHQSGRFGYSILQRWLAVAGLPGRPFHSLRATTYKLARAKGWGIAEAAALLGDTHRVAEEFYGAVGPSDLAAKIAERPLL